MSKFTNSILVTGDVIADTDVYVGQRMLASTVADEGTAIRSSAGGASLTHKLIERLAVTLGKNHLEIHYGFNETALEKLPAHLVANALYRRFKAGTTKAPEKRTVWRVAEALGYGAPPTDAREPDLTSIVTSVPPRVLVVDDGGAGFRSLAASQRWPFAVKPDPEKPPARWIVLKMARPVAQGDLWRTVSGEFGDAAKGAHEGFADRLVTVVNADFLRLREGAISRGMSWERTVQDICQELASNFTVRPLLLSRHLLIVFRHEGVLWLDTSKPVEQRTHLIFDPSFCEGEWETTLTAPNGEVFGNLTVFTAFVALELARQPEIDDASFAAVLKAGVEATRVLRMTGHEPDPVLGTSSTPCFPFGKLTQVAEAHFAGRLETSLTTATVPCCDNVCVPKGNWAIISHHERRFGGTHPLFGTAMQTALKGISALRNVPHAQFGKLTSVDRDEMESLRTLRIAIQRYVQNPGKPLAIGVFGPPGAGKSFGVKQIAEEVFAGKPCIMEFNLSQFANTNDLIGAFHQVRDRVLEGSIPVIFWDEFDSQQYHWLRHFLAPLQDGRFQEGQISHAISRCIFVFAGGTSCDFEHFGPAPDAQTKDEKESLAKRHANAQTRESDEQRRLDFILKKGPDFVSRLDVHFNVLGPNQKAIFNFETGLWDRPDSSDVGFPIRRALLIRGVLGLDARAPLSIEPVLLEAFLRISKYRHGARSLEKLILALRTKPGEKLRRANLPPLTALARHLYEADELDRLCAENRPYQSDENLLRVAAAVHENYQRIVEGKPPDVDYLQHFYQLGPWEKATNVAAAARLPEILAIAGLRLISGQADETQEAEVRGQLQHHLPALAEREHELWVGFHEQNNWAPSKVRDKAKRRHPLMVPFEKLGPRDKAKDHNAILAYPELARLAGYKIVFA